MLKAARSAPSQLRDARDNVIGFLRGQFNGDGGAKGRSGESDLYYTVFALDGLAAMGVDLPVDSTLAYLRRFEDGAQLDFVHRACLARCWASMPPGSLEAGTARKILQHIETHRSKDGGYGHSSGGESGTVYHSFLALGAYQDLGGELFNPEGLARCVDRLRTGDGAFANDSDVKLGTTPTTAAAVILMRHLGREVPQSASDWLLARCHPDGGFLAVQAAPLPDLLSTATALHALAELNVSTAEIREACLDFVDSLWTGRAFRGHPADDVEDCEYTYYGLLALGHLSS